MQFLSYPNFEFVFYFSVKACLDDIGYDSQFLNMYHNRSYKLYVAVQFIPGAIHPDLEYPYRPNWNYGYLHCWHKYGLPSFSEEAVEIQDQWSLPTHTWAIIHGLPRLFITTHSLYPVPSVNSREEGCFMANSFIMFLTTPVKQKSKTHHGPRCCDWSKVRVVTHSPLSLCAHGSTKYFKTRMLCGHIIRILNYMKILYLNWKCQSYCQWAPNNVSISRLFRDHQISAFA